MDDTKKALKDLIDSARWALLSGNIPEFQRRQLHDATQRASDHLRALRAQEPSQ